MPDSSSTPKVRKFGLRASDLDSSIPSADRVETAVKLVARYSELACGEKEALNWAWSLPIGVRALQILKIVQDSQDEPDLLFFQKCPQSGCGEKLALCLPLEALISHGEEALAQGEQLTWELEDSRRISFRRATGRDQLSWRAGHFTNQKDVNRALLEALVVDGEQNVETLKAQDEVQLSEVMREFDPLVSFRLATECPACKKQALIAADIEQLCLNRMKQIQTGLLKAVHRLAKAYGWTEGEILGLSTRRRNYYLNCVEREDLER